MFGGAAPDFESFLFPTCHRKVGEIMTRVFGAYHNFGNFLCILVISYKLYIEREASYFYVFSSL